MIDQGRMLLDCGVALEHMLLDDIFNPLHLRYTVRLDHAIDDDFIREAWEKTKRVYPILDSVLEFDEGDKTLYLDPAQWEQHKTDHMYLMKPTSGESHPVKTKVPVGPDTEAAGNRLIAVSYHDDTIWLSAYHSLVDGSGFHKVLDTFLYTYLALYTGHEDEHPIVELREGRALEDYYVAAGPEFVFAQSYTPVPLYELPPDCVGFYDDDMVEDEGTIWAGTMHIDSADFMQLCKSNGANPSAMIATLLGRVAYDLNPDQREDIVYDFTISTRNLVGLEESIANCVGIGISYATRDDIENKPLAEVAQRIRSELSAQRTHDYFVSLVRDAFTSRRPKDVPVKYRVITYLGTISIGDNDKHVLDACFDTNGCRNVYLLEAGDHFVLSVHHGRATQKYLEGFAKVFDELGVKATIACEAHLADVDAMAPVL